MPSNPTYEEWSRLLAGAFFPEAEGRRLVYFAVDDDILDELVEASSPGTGARSLVRAVRPRLDTADPQRLFEPLAQEAYAWSGRRPRPEIPNFLAGLAVTILAASRMDEGDGIAATNYYDRLREVLEVPSLPGSAFRETVPSVFRILREWLNGIPGRRRGISTVPEVVQPEHVGFPLSQVQFRESDRRKLTSFFRQYQLKATDSENARMLLAPARDWAGRTNLSVGAKRLLRSPENEVAAVALIASELARWDESERDERGRHVGLIRLTLQVIGRPRWGMLATRPDGFPDEADFDFDGRLVHLQSSVDGFYDPVIFEGGDDPLLTGILRGNLTLRCASGVLRFLAGAVIPMGADPFVGAMVSRRRIEPGERHFVLVRPELGDAVAQLLDSCGREGWTSRPEIAPTGWLLLSDVFVDLPPMQAVDDALAPLAPSVDSRPELVGGLRLEGPGREHRYLQTGEPDLWLPDWLIGQARSHRDNRWEPSGMGP